MSEGPRLNVLCNFPPLLGVVGWVAVQQSFTHAAFIHLIFLHCALGNTLGPQRMEESSWDERFSVSSYNKILSFMRKEIQGAIKEQRGTTVALG